MIYSIDELKELVEPIAKKYKIKAVWVFGSYARGEATEESNVDFLMDYTDSIDLNLCGFLNMADELELTFNNKVDLISTDTLNGHVIKKYFSKIMNIINNECVILYVKS